MAKKEKERKGKKPHRKTVNKKKSDYYKVEGDGLVRNKKNCPKCGRGVFLAEHKDRLTCGECHYTEWKDKKPF